MGKPRRLPSIRRAVTDDRLAEICQAADGGDDPELDTLLLRLHTETACRRGGALALRPDDLDTHQCLIRLREKGETVRWQPVSPTLTARLVAHGQERHVPPGGQLLRYRTGRPITSRRYDGLWARIGRALPWVRPLPVKVNAGSASRSPKPTRAMRTAAGEPGPWPPWPPTSAPGCPRWQQPWPPRPLPVADEAPAA